MTLLLGATHEPPSNPKGPCTKSLGQGVGTGLAGALEKGGVELPGQAGVPHPALCMIAIAGLSAKPQGFLQEVESKGGRGVLTGSDSKLYNVIRRVGPDNSDAMDPGSGTS